MFSWDAQKAISNYEKHGVSFEEAASVFSVSRFGDPDALDWEDVEHSTSEQRSKRLGISSAGGVLLVVYPIRRVRHGEETIRIFSARHASRKGRKAYA